MAVSAITHTATCSSIAAPKKTIDGRRLGNVFGHRAALGAFAGAPIAELACGGSTNGTL
jgi:uncharacterized membrane protein